MIYGHLRSGLEFDSKNVETVIIQKLTILGFWSDTGAMFDKTSVISGSSKAWLTKPDGPFWCTGTPLTPSTGESAFTGLKSRNEDLIQLLPKKVAKSRR